MKKPNVLIIDDNKDFVNDLLMLLRGDYQCTGVHSGEEGLALLEKSDQDLILLDIELGKGIDGFEFLERMKELEYSTPVVMITRDVSIDTVVRAIKKGACDYVGKKPDLSELKRVIDRALNEFGLMRENTFLKEEIHRLMGELLGKSEMILEVKKEIRKLAGADVSVLITGESGTGKELVARQLHKGSRREGKPFVAVNCAAIPRELFESELFGHEKGAFTGALKRKLGKFELADGGTIFLDEIGELDSSAQAKFLRVLKDRTIERVGSEKGKPVDVRVLAATNRDLEERIKEGLFREDLFYRLNVTRIHIPPLRERKQDIPILANEFVRIKGYELKKHVEGISEDALQMLITYDWPGNVRELENMIENAIIYTEEPVLDRTLFPSLLTNYSECSDYESAKQTALERFQREYVSAILHLTGGNVTRAAARMGISRQGLQKIMRNLDIDTVSSHKRSFPKPD